MQMPPLPNASVENVWFLRVKIPFCVILACLTGSQLPKMYK